MDQTQLQTIWEQILQKIQEQESLTEAACKKWLAPVKSVPKNCPAHAKAMLIMILLLIYYIS